MQVPTWAREVDASVELTRSSLEEALTARVAEVTNKSEYLWGDARRNFKLDADGQPAVQAAVANCPQDYDLWQGLRNPALVGLHPVGIQEILKQRQQKSEICPDFMCGRRMVICALEERIRREAAVPVSA